MKLKENARRSTKKILNKEKGIKATFMNQSNDFEDFLLCYIYAWFEMRSFHTVGNYVVIVIFQKVRIGSNKCSYLKRTYPQFLKFVMLTLVCVCSV